MKGTFNQFARANNKYRPDPGCVSIVQLIPPGSILTVTTVTVLVFIMGQYLNF